MTPKRNAKQACIGRCPDNTNKNSEFHKTLVICCLWQKESSDALLTGQAAVGNGSWEQSNRPNVGFTHRLQGYQLFTAGDYRHSLRAGMPLCPNEESTAKSRLDTQLISPGHQWVSLRIPHVHWWGGLALICMRQPRQCRKLIEPFWLCWVATRGQVEQERQKSSTGLQEMGHCSVWNSLESQRRFSKAKWHTWNLDLAYEEFGSSGGARSFVVLLDLFDQHHLTNTSSKRISFSPQICTFLSFQAIPLPYLAPNR